jgi:hypothetical protein
MAEQILIPASDYLECSNEEEGLKVSVTKTGTTSDGYHTFDELYDHRCLLFLIYLETDPPGGFKSLCHHDGSKYEGWFIAGCEFLGKAITYHLPIKYWNLCGASEKEKAPVWDGHTSQDVIKRMEDHLKYWVQKNP